MDNLNCMLRQTSRLQQHLDSIGRALIEPPKGSQHTLYRLQEAEFIVSALETTIQNASTLRSGKRRPSTISAPPGFDFWMLEALMKRSGDSWGADLIQSDCLSRYYRVRRPVKWRFDNQSINILWLSTYEFVSSFNLNEEDSYSVEFSFNRRWASASKWSSLKLYAH
jgi:hypothetical protein